MPEVFTNTKIFRAKTLRKAHEAVAASNLADQNFAWTCRPADLTHTSKRTTVGTIRGKLEEGWREWT
jgi:hypothetical protein